MPIKHPNLHLTRLVGAIPAWLGMIEAGDLRTICQTVRDGGGRLVALWGSDARAEGKGFVLHVALVNEAGLICLNLPLAAEQPSYPTLAGFSCSQQDATRGVRPAGPIRARRP